MDPAVQHQLDVLTKLCSQKIAVQSEGQRALIENLGQTQLTLRQFAAETARNLGIVPPPIIHLGAEQGTPPNRNPNLPSYDGGTPPIHWVRTITDMYEALAD